MIYFSWLEIKEIIMNHLYKFMITIALFFGALMGVSAEDTSVDKLERIVQKLVMPPLLPVHEQVATGEPKIV